MPSAAAPRTSLILLACNQAATVRAAAESCLAQQGEPFLVGALFGFARLSHILKMVEADIRGRLVVFFPGHLERSNYRLLDARDGWNYMAVPITLHGDGGVQ